MKRELCSAGVALLIAWPGRAADLRSLGAAAARYESGASVDEFQQLDLQWARAAGNPALARELETALIRMLQPDATTEARLFACQRLAGIGGAASVPALATLLRNPDSVGMACLALASYPAGNADAALRDVLPSLTGIPKTQVIAALGHRRDSKAVPALGTLARADSPVGEAAIVALGRIGDPSARRTLALLRKEPGFAHPEAVSEGSLILADDLVARGDAKAAVAICRELTRPGRPSHVRAGAFGRWLRTSPDDGLSLIEGLFRRERPELQPDAPLRPVAIAAMGRIRHPDAPRRCAELFPLLSDPEKVLLQDALADFGPRAPRAAIASRLDDPNADLRLAAIRAFARLNQAVDIPIFVHALAQAQTPPERQTIEAALVQLPGGTQTDRALLVALSGAPAQAKPVLLTSLARRGSPAVVAELLAQTTSADPAMGRAAWQGLGRLGTASQLDEMLDSALRLQNPARQEDAGAALARVLGRIPDESVRAQAVCSRLAAATAPEARAFMIRLLPLAGGSRSLEAAQVAARDDAAPVRDAAVRALADWPTGAAWDALMAICRRADNDPHRALAFRGLVRLATEENTQAGDALIGRYRELIDAARTNDERKLILGGLGGCGRPEALELALAHLANPAVRAEAEQAVRQIAAAVKEKHPEAAGEALQKLGVPDFQR